MSTNDKAPDGAGWNASAYAVVGMNVSFEQAAVQFVGTHAVLLGAAAITVPFETLFTMVAQLMHLMPQQYPAIALLAASVENDAALADELRTKWGLPSTALTRTALSTMHAQHLEGMHADAIDTRQLTLVE